jgi:hypothetical protein
LAKDEIRVRGLRTWLARVGVLLTVLLGFWRIEIADI